MVLFAEFNFVLELPPQADCKIRFNIIYGFRV